MNSFRLISVESSIQTSRASRRGDAAKVVIITVCVFLMIMLMLCVGGGIYGYVLFQRNFGRIAITTPADVQKLTTEITDIDLPSQFTPVLGSAFLTMKSVNYAWNPEGKTITSENWHEHRGDSMHMLNLTEMDGERGLQDQNFRIAQVQIKSLKSQYTDFTNDTREYTIRGKKCEFLFVTGNPTLGAFDDEMIYDEADEERIMEEEAAANPAEPAEKPVDAAPPQEGTAPVDPTSPPSEAAAAPAEPAPSAPAGPPLPKVRTVTGSFPGKSGYCTITIRIPAEGTDDEVLPKIIQSIR